MSNNILDKDAMQTIAEIKAELPHLVAAMERLAANQESGQEKTNNRLDRVTEQVAELSRDNAVMRADLDSLKQHVIGSYAALEKKVEDIPDRCPHRESVAKIDGIESSLGSLRDRVDSNSEEVSSLKTTYKVAGSIVTALSGLVSALTAWILGNTT